MAEYKHTPGPWQIGFSDGSGKDEFYIVGPGDVAVVHGRGDCCKIGGIFEEENARLIAVAPELLDALKALLSLVEHDTDLPQQAANGVVAPDGADEGVNVACEILARVHYIVSKAQGG